MNDCKKCQALLVEALYGELDPKEKDFFAKHTASCPACEAEFEALAKTLRTMDERVRPEPGREFWDGYWDRLSRQMEKEGAAEETPPSWEKTPGRTWGFLPRWAFQTAAALALIVAGIFIGRTIFSPRSVSVEASLPAM